MPQQEEWFFKVSWKLTVINGWLKWSDGKKAEKRSSKTKTFLKIGICYKKIYISSLKVEKLKVTLGEHTIYIHLEIRKK